MAYKILHDWHTECSACGGNASINEDRHTSGGPDPGGTHGPANPRSYLNEKNGCGAMFDEPAQHSITARRINGD